MRKTYSPEFKAKLVMEVFRGERLFREIASENNVHPNMLTRVTVTDSDGNAIPAKLVYARNYSNRKDWVCFVCTNTSMFEKEILEAYMLRWEYRDLFQTRKKLPEAAGGMPQQPCLTA